jgi:hypothetical protein
MARYKRIPQNIGGQRTFTAHRDFADICPACGRYIKRGEWYVLKGRTAYHNRCKDLPDQLERLKPKAKPKLLPQDVEGRRRAAERKKARRERRAEKRRQEQARNEQMRQTIAAQIQDERDNMSRFDHAISADD